MRTMRILPNSSPSGKGSWPSRTDRRDAEEAFCWSRIRSCKDTTPIHCEGIWDEFVKQLDSPDVRGHGCDACGRGEHCNRCKDGPAVILAHFGDTPNHKGHL